MLRKMTMSVAATAALTLASAAHAQQVEAPREVNQEQGRGTQEREVQQRAGNPNIDRTGPVTGAPRPGGVNTLQNGITTQNGVNTQNGASGAIVVGERGDSSQELSSRVANCVLLHNNEEITLAKFALQHTQNPKVKDFAQMLIDDHQKFGEKLQKFANHSGHDNSRAGTLQPAASDRREARQEERQQRIEDRQLRQAGQDGAAPAQRTEVRVGYAGPMNQVSDEMFQIEKQAVQNCSQMVQEQLSKEKGADFDRCFVGMQIGAHIGMLAHLKAAESHVHGDLQQVLKDGEQTTAAHKQQAEKLAEELKDQK